MGSNKNRGSSPAQIEQQLQDLLRQRAIATAEEHLLMRRQYLEVAAKLRNALTPLGLTLRSFLQMSEAEVAEYYDRTARDGRAGKDAVDLSSSQTVGKVPPRYRHPRDRSLTWTGRGNKPRWIVSYLMESPGRQLEDLLIDKRAAGRRHSTRVVPARYGHPTIPELTWTGSGHVPHWVLELLDSDDSLELADLLLEDAKHSASADRAVRAALRKLKEPRRRVAKRITISVKPSADRGKRSSKAAPKATSGKKVATARKSVK